MIPKIPVNVVKYEPLRVRHLDNGTSASERSGLVATLIILTASKADFESARQYNFISICCGLGDR